MKKIFKALYIEAYSFLNGISLLFLNSVVSRVPFHLVRLIIYRAYFSIGRDSSILMGVTIRGVRISIGANSIVNSGCLLDGRGGIVRIGNNVDVAPFVKIWTVEHDPNSPMHEPVNADVVVEDNVWIASSAVILPGVRIAEGTVVAAGSLVCKDTVPYSIVAGTPAKKIGDRQTNIQYKHRWRPWFQ